MNKLYPLRFDIRSNLVDYNGKEWILLDDPMGYADSPVIISPEFYNILVSIDGELDIKEILNLENEEHGDITIEPILAQIQTLDEMGFLLSDSFNQKRAIIENDYIESSIRPAICSGTTYPSNAEELDNFLEHFFSSTIRNAENSLAHSILVPHIDFRLGNIASEVYSSAYHTFMDSDAELFVIFGTSHYINSGQYMLTRKNYETPLGIAEVDVDLLDYLQSNHSDTFVMDDFAHKPEHSIEMQVVLLQHYFKNRKFKILPVLVGSMHRYILNNIDPTESSEIFEFIDALKNYFVQNNIKAAFIASVDFAHIGLKFQDEFDAKEKLDELEIEDYKLIQTIVDLSPIDFYSKIASDKDKWRICGTAPIYALLNANNFKEARLNKYNQWYESETQSAVSFASISFYD